MFESEPRRGATIRRTSGAAPSALRGLRDHICSSVPAAHAAGYYLPPLRGSALAKTDILSDTVRL